MIEIRINDDKVDIDARATDLELKLLKELVKHLCKECKEGAE